MTEKESADGEVECIEARERSPLAQEIERLKKASFRAATDKERLPQPLFWSLFGHAIRDLRKKKREIREISDLLEGSES